MNREEWLHVLAEKHLWPRIKAAGGKACPKYRIACGWPRGSRGGKSGHAIGQCWSAKASADGHVEIFVSPALAVDRVVDVLLHELVHASVGNEAGHGPKFKKLALAVGLAGQMKATVAGPELVSAAKGYLSKMPKYPHAPLIATDVAKERKPGSRLLKSYCGGCGYTVRITRQWIEVARPVCPDESCDQYGKPFEVDLPGEGD